MTFPADNFRAIDSKERMTGGAETLCLMSS